MDEFLGNGVIGIRQDACTGRAGIGRITQYGDQPQVLFLDAGVENGLVLKDDVSDRTQSGITVMETGQPLLVELLSTDGPKEGNIPPEAGKTGEIDIPEGLVRLDTVANVLPLLDLQAIKDGVPSAPDPQGIGKSLTTKDVAALGPDEVVDEPDSKPGVIIWEEPAYLMQDAASYLGQGCHSCD